MSCQNSACQRVHGMPWPSCSGNKYVWSFSLWKISKIGPPEGPPAHPRGPPRGPSRAQGWAQARFLEIWKSGTWKFGNLGNVGKVWTGRKKSSWPHLGPSGPIFCVGRKMQTKSKFCLFSLVGQCHDCCSTVRDVQRAACLNSSWSWQLALRKPKRSTIRSVVNSSKGPKLVAVT